MFIPRCSVHDHLLNLHASIYFIRKAMCFFNAWYIIHWSITITIVLIIVSLKSYGTIHIYTIYTHSLYLLFYFKPVNHKPCCSNQHDTKRDNQCHQEDHVSLFWNINTNVYIVCDVYVIRSMFTLTSFPQNSELLLIVIQGTIFLRKSSSSYGDLQANTRTPLITLLSCILELIVNYVVTTDYQ